MDRENYSKELFDTLVYMECKDLETLLASGSYSSNTLTDIATKITKNKLYKYNKDEFVLSIIKNLFVEREENYRVSSFIREAENATSLSEISDNSMKELIKSLSEEINVDTRNNKIIAIVFYFYSVENRIELFEELFDYFILSIISDYTSVNYTFIRNRMISKDDIFNFLKKSLYFYSKNELLEIYNDYIENKIISTVEASDYFFNGLTNSNLRFKEFLEFILFFDYSCGSSKHIENNKAKAFNSSLISVSYDRENLSEENIYNFMSRIYRARGSHFLTMFNLFSYLIYSNKDFLIDLTSDLKIYIDSLPPALYTLGSGVEAEETEVPDEELYMDLPDISLSLSSLRFNSWDTRISINSSINLYSLTSFVLLKYYEYDLRENDLLINIPENEPYEGSNLRGLPFYFRWEWTLPASEFMMRIITYYSPDFIESLWTKSSTKEQRTYRFFYANLLMKELKIENIDRLYSKIYKDLGPRKVTNYTTNDIPNKVESERSINRYEFMYGSNEARVYSVSAIKQYLINVSNPIDRALEIQSYMEEEDLLNSIAPDVFGKIYPISYKIEYFKNFIVPAVEGSVYVNYRYSQLYARFYEMFINYCSNVTSLENEDESVLIELKDIIRNQILNTPANERRMYGRNNIFNKREIIALENLYKIINDINDDDYIDQDLLEN